MGGVDFTGVFYVLCSFKAPATVCISTFVKEMIRVMETITSFMFRSEVKLLL